MTDDMMMIRKLMRTENSVRLWSGQLRNTRHGTRDTPGPPSQDLTLGWKQPESDNTGPVLLRQGEPGTSQYLIAQFALT